MNEVSFLKDLVKTRDSDSILTMITSHLARLEIDLGRSFLVLLDKINCQFAGRPIDVAVSVTRGLRIGTRLVKNSGHQHPKSREAAFALGDYLVVTLGQPVALPGDRQEISGFFGDLDTVFHASTFHSRRRVHRATEGRNAS